MQEQKKALVTGGGGFLGKAIVRRLVERGDRVRSFSRGRSAAGQSDIAMMTSLSS